MFQDYKDLLYAFHVRGVKYLIVGGYAVIFHAQPRFTKDLDFFVHAEDENAKAVFSALADFGAPLVGIRQEDFTDKSSFFRFGHDPRGFDILPSIAGVDFEEAWENRVEALIDEKSGLIAYFISANDLIAAKVASGRPQDLADADAVRKAQRLRQTPQKDKLSNQAD